VLIELLSIFSFRPHQYRKGLRRYPGDATRPWW